MALTISIEGKGVIANADQATNDTGGTGTGDWGFSGSGGVAWGATTDTFYYGTTAMSMALSGNGKNGWLYFDIGSGNELDFGASGSEENQHIYFWVHCPTIGLSASLANAGVAIRIGTDTSNYRTFVIAGSDGSNGWTGGWRCFVIDPTKTGSISDTGTYNTSSLRYFGIRGQTTATAKGDNFFISQIAVGSGLRITGTSTAGWKDAVDYCTALTSRAWGMLQQREGIYYAYGTIYIGDAASQSAAVSFVDSGRVLQFGISEYYNGSSWVTSADIDYCGIVIEDHSSYTTTFTDGVIVGSEEGRSGSTIAGNANHDVSIDFYGGNNASSVTELYGTVLRGLRGSLVSGNDAQHKFLSVSFIACSQFDPVGAPVLRNCVFAETADAAAALLWNANIDVADCSFIANTTGAGVEHPEVSFAGYAYDGLSFSGNTYDIRNSDNAATISAGSFVVGRAYKIATAGSTDFTAIGAADNNVGTKFVATGVGSGTGTATEVLLINATNGANPSQTKVNNTGTNADALVQNAVTLFVKVQDADRVAIENVQTSIKLLDAPYTQLMNEDTLSTGVAQESYNYGGSEVDVVVKARKSETTDNPRYRAYSEIQTIDANGLNLTITLREQPVPI